MSAQRYLFLGGKQTRSELRETFCDPVKFNGKCVVNTKLASALIVDAKGERYVVPRRRLRLAENLTDEKFLRAHMRRLMRERKLR